LAYAIIVHKAQGITVPRAVLNITTWDFAPAMLLLLCCTSGLLA
jgi:hypothetical protein